MNKKISIYYLAVTVFIWVCITVFFGWSVRHVYIGNNRLGQFGEAMVAIAEFPSLVKEVLGIIKDGTGALVIPDHYPLVDGFSKNGKIQLGSMADKGYLLLSSYNNSKQQSTVELIRIADNHILKEWAPNIDQILSLTKSNIQKSSAQIHNPLLVENGCLIFNNIESLIKIGPSASVEWIAEGSYHHSVERDADGNIWACSVMKPSTYEGVLTFSDNAIAKISPEGKVLFKKSVAKILEENGFRGLLSIGFRLQNQGDPIHLNDIQPALTDSKYWKKGDLMLSMRHLSTIALYRPSTNKIIWLKTGPWMNQHDVEFVSDHEISVFGNNVIDDVKKGRVFLDGHNIVYLYDFMVDKVSSPYDKAMSTFSVRTKTNGRSKILSNGDVFIDESENGRLLRLTPITAKWEFVRRVNNNHVSISSWSRYLTEEEVRRIYPNL